MDLFETEKAIEYIDATDRSTWIKVGAAIKSEFGDEGFAVWDKWSQKAGNYNAQAARSSWKSFRTGKVGLGSLIYLAKQGGYSPSKLQRSPTQASPSPKKSNQSETDEIKRRTSAREKSQEIWKKSHTVSKHAYLENKRINHPEVIKSIKQIRFSGVDLLLIPVRDIKGTIHSLQYINEEGSKRFTKDGMIKGNFAVIGDESKAKEGIILAEGLATAASLYQASGIPVVIAFNAENMKEVAKELNRANFAKNYIVACDNDMSATGINKALDAAKELNNAQMIVPSFGKKDIEEYQKYYPNKLPSDFNDLHLVKGLNAVSQTISQINRNSVEKPLTVDNQDNSVHTEDIKETQEENTIEINASGLSKSLPLEEEIAKGTTFDSENQAKKIAIIDLNYIIPFSVQKHYLTNNGKFFNKKMELQFIDTGAQLKAKVHNEPVIKHMLDVVEAKNWSSIKVAGDKEFKKMVWFEAFQRNIKVEGYRPSKEDLALVKHLTNDLSNTIEKNIEKPNTVFAEKNSPIDVEKTQQEVTVAGKDSIHEKSDPTPLQSVEQVKEKFVLAAKKLNEHDQLKVHFLESEFLDVVEKLPKEKQDNCLRNFYENLTKNIDKGDLSFSYLHEQREVNVARETSINQEIEQTVSL